MAHRSGCVSVHPHVFVVASHGSDPQQSLSSMQAAPDFMHCIVQLCGLTGSSGFYNNTCHHHLPLVGRSWMSSKTCSLGYSILIQSQLADTPGLHLCWCTTAALLKTHTVIGAFVWSTIWPFSYPTGSSLLVAGPCAAAIGIHCACRSVIGALRQDGRSQNVVYIYIYIYLYLYRYRYRYRYKSIMAAAQDSQCWVGRHYS